MNIQETYNKSKQIYQLGKDELINTSIKMKDTGKNILKNMNNSRKENPILFYSISIPIIATAITVDYYLLKDTPYEFMQALNDTQKYLK